MWTQRQVDREDGKTKENLPIPVSLVHHNAVPQSVGQQKELQQHGAACGSLQAGERAAGGSLQQRQPQVTLTQRPLQLTPQEAWQLKQHSLL